MNTTTRANSDKSSLYFLGFLITLLLFFFARSFDPNLIVFSNDGPLGINASAASQLPSGFKAWWWDLNWAGTHIPSATPNLSGILRWVIGPLYYAKFYPFACLLVLGMCAWLFFRVLRFHPVICGIGGIAAAFNANALSNMAWGQGSRPLALAAAFLALAAIHSARFGNHWIKLILAGLAVGWGVSEGFDVGALFSICLAIFAVFFALISEQTMGQKLGKSIANAAVIAIFAGLLAAHTVTALVKTQLQDRGSATPAGMSAEQEWSFITDLSTPKLEVLGVVVPGLFGYGTTTPGDKVYWGQQSRYNGSGEYAGVLVVVLALSAIALSFRKDSNLSVDRRLTWFWSAMGLVCLLLAFGKYAPFYKLIYPLPFFSSMRNPMKFMHVFHLCLLVLFGIGLQAIYELYLKNGARKAQSIKSHLSKWWSNAPKFDRKYTAVLATVVGAGLLGWLIYSSSKIDLIEVIQKTGLPQARAAQVASVSIAAVGWFVLFFSISVALLVLIISGWFSGKGSRFALLLLGLVVTADLVKADYPWFVYWNYKNKYASNPVIDFLREKPYEKRVDIVPIPHPEMQWLSQLFGVEWAQHQFFYYNIQASHIVQDPRPLPDDAAYRKAFSEGDTLEKQVALLFRKWELMSTRYLFWLGGQFTDALNQQFPAAAKGRFKAHTRFDLVPRPDLKQGAEIGLSDLTAVLNPNGKFAVVEFSGALPKAKLFSSYQVFTNSDEALQKLTSPEFDPQTSVILQENIRMAPSQAADGSPGTVEFVSYAPKHIELATDAKIPSVLLLNDKYHPDWKVWVDGKPAIILRGNYIMRAVALDAGQHTVVFKFEPPYSTLYVTISAIALGAILCGFLFVARRKTDHTEQPKVAVAQ